MCHVAKNEQNLKDSSCRSNNSKYINENNLKN